MATIFSDDRTRRYRLERSWSPGFGQSHALVGFVMLNPSKADEHSDDPTVRKCIGFAKRWGYTGIVVTNLIPVISTDPSRLPYWGGLYMDNAPFITEALRECPATVVAWGSVPKHIRRNVALAEHIWHFNELAGDRELFCIGTTKGGNPLHPGRAAYTNAMEKW